MCPCRPSRTDALRRLLPALILAVTLTACTPRWVETHACPALCQRPESAIAADDLTRWWANVGALLWHWAAVADCESSGDPTTNTGNGYYGAYQFDLTTWSSVGGRGLPSDASLLEQTLRADELRRRAGLGPWPVCGRYYR